MRYNNYTNDAIYELERQRTLNYGMDYESSDQHDSCDSCGCDNKDIFEVDNHHLCGDCICDVIRDAFEEIEPSSGAYGIDAVTIFKAMVNDFSDSEILSYVEELYEKV